MVTSDHARALPEAAGATFEVTWAAQKPQTTLYYIQFFANLHVLHMFRKVSSKAIEANRIKTKQATSAYATCWLLADLSWNTSKSVVLYSHISIGTSHTLLCTEVHPITINCNLMWGIRYGGLFLWQKAACNCPNQKCEINMWRVWVSGR